MRKYLVIITVAIVLAIVGYTYFMYFNTYDRGFREGVLYNFSRKGDVIKTYEGIIIQPGLRPNSRGGLNTNEFHFSVTDAAIADSLSHCIGKTVQLQYEQYRRSLPWRGENNNVDNKDNGQFIVTGIDKVSETAQQPIGL